jgi:5-methylcytosine-specific restriction enzyme subunit McrC
MAYVFQYFVFNFLRLERADASVFRENIRWSPDRDSPVALSLLAQMQTDVSVIISDRKVIIETKYYTDTLSYYFESATIHSANLYQLLSYMSNSKHLTPKIEGILLYPKVDRELDERYVILDMPPRVKTIDLNRSWSEIHDDLYGLLNSV